MMKISYITVIIGCTLLMFSCVSDNSEKLVIKKYERRLDTYKGIIDEKEKFISLLNNELDEISTDLNNIQPENDSLLFRDPIDKITFYDSLLTQSTNKVYELENLLKKASNAGDARLLKTMVTDLNSRLIEKEKVITELRIENKQLKLENDTLNIKVADLKEETDELKDEVSQSKDRLKDVLIETKKVISKASDENNELIAENKNLIEEQNRVKRNLHFRIAVESLKKADKIKVGIFAKNKKEIKTDLILTAYENFREACKLGHDEASRYIRILISSKTYYEYLEINRSAKSISECGI